MTRDYHRWYSRSLNRDMELLVFGHGGMPYIVFPSSMGAFFEFEDRDMVQAVAEKLPTAAGCSWCACRRSTARGWYGRHQHPRQRLDRHLQYESYLLTDVVPLIRQINQSPAIGVTGCSFGAYQLIECLQTCRTKVMC